MKLVWSGEIEEFECIPDAVYARAEMYSRNHTVLMKIFIIPIPIPMRTFPEYTRHWYVGLHFLQFGWKWIDLDPPIFAWSWKPWRVTEVRRR